MSRMVKWGGLLVGLALAVGCSGSAGSNGANGANGSNGTNATSLASLTGTVVDTYGNKVSGATVSVVVGSDTLKTTTSSTGAYTLSLPIGSRTVTFAATGYASLALPVDLQPAATATLNATLNPTDAVVVVASRTGSGNVAPGAQVTLGARLLVFDPSLDPSTATFSWTVKDGPAATITGGTTAAPQATLASRLAWKTYAVEKAAPKYKVNPDEPSIAIDRYQVVPFTYDEAVTFLNKTTFQVTVTLGGKQYKATVVVPATLPLVQSSGLNNVPMNQPVVLQGQFPFKDSNGAYVFTPRSTWSWSVTDPNGAAVTLNDPTAAYPDFTPTAAGRYSVSEGGTLRFYLYAAQYMGVMSAAGTANAFCVGCHGDTFASWLQTGHKNVIWDGISEPLPGGHYTSSCTGCHTVGNGLTGVAGFQDAVNATSPAVDFGALQGDVRSEQDFWRLYPAVAKLGGIQCENCHGPQGNAHGTTTSVDLSTAPRMSYSANVCAQCHARINRHGRYPQWKNSGHASFATFTFNSDETNGKVSKSCAGCHSAQGFRAARTWMGNHVSTSFNVRNDSSWLPTDLTVFTAEPVTCAACHDSHEEGEAGKVEWQHLAKVGPAEGQTYTLPSGFAAVGVGKGALCITCHNSRQGVKSGQAALHEDGDPLFDTTLTYGAPHEACQGDVLLGRNGWWLGADVTGSPATRSAHSYITDSCVTCHMVLTDPDPVNGMAGQTRHDFKATTTVCNQCHTAYNPESIQAAFDARLDQAKAAAGRAILRLKYDDAIPAGTTANLVANRSGQVDVTSGGVTRRYFISDTYGSDAFVVDPATGTTLTSCAAAATPGTYDCTGFLHGAPGVTAIGKSTATGQDATVTTESGSSGPVGGVSQVIARALWNIVLVQDDASRGIHNPSFSVQVLDATIDHLKTFKR